MSTVAGTGTLKGHGHIQTFTRLNVRRDVIHPTFLVEIKSCERDDNGDGGNIIVNGYGNAILGVLAGRIGQVVPEKEEFGLIPGELLMNLLIGVTK